MKMINMHHEVIMKSIMLIVVTMLISLGCKNGMGPKYEIKIPIFRSPTPNPTPECTDYYRSIIRLKFDNGDPVTRAFVSFDSGYDTDEFNSSAHHLVSETGCDESNPPTIALPCTVKVGSYTDPTHVWIGDVVFTKNVWPDPIEIIIHDRALAEP